MSKLKNVLNNHKMNNYSLKQEHLKLQLKEMHLYKNIHNIPLVQ